MRCLLRCVSHSQAAKLEQHLEQQLRLDAASTPAHHVVTPIHESEDSTSDSIDSCKSYRTPKNPGRRDSSNSSGSGRGLGESGCGRPPSLALFEVGRERAETIVGDSCLLYTSPSPRD